MILYSVRFKVVSAILALALTVSGYLLHAYPGILKGILQWTPLLLLAFLLMISAVTTIWHAVHNDRPNATGALPADVGFRLISKWGLRW